MNEKKLPIGYWIKEVDTLLTKGIDDIQHQLGLNRTGWQILNSINEEGNYNKTELINLLLPFSSADETEAMINKFADEKIIHSQQNQLSLTSKGKELHTACFERQKQFRQEIMEGISEQDYDTAISTLQKMVLNISGKK